MSQEKPTADEVNALLRREALARIRLTLARARVFNATVRADPKVSYHTARSYSIEQTENELRRYERARVALLTAAYAANSMLVTGTDNMHLGL
jgi:hypothetical protein